MTCGSSFQPISTSLALDPQVDTAVIAPHVGGAVAKPFITHSSAINANMYLRISPELHLKVWYCIKTLKSCDDSSFLACLLDSNCLLVDLIRCMSWASNTVTKVGFFTHAHARVIACLTLLHPTSIGIDSTHNPEFTSCEFYEAYGDMSSLINRTEAIVRGMYACLSCFSGFLLRMHFVASGMVECVHSSRVIPYTTQSGEVLSLDFASPFKRISVVSELQSRLDVTLPPLWDTGMPCILRQPSTFCVELLILDHMFKFTCPTRRGDIVFTEDSM